jgi:superfamily II DNA or RNA helicase
VTIVEAPDAETWHIDMPGPYITGWAAVNRVVKPMARFEEVKGRKVWSIRKADAVKIANTLCFLPQTTEWKTGRCDDIILALRQASSARKRRWKGTPTTPSSDIEDRLKKVLPDDMALQPAQMAMVELWERHGVLNADDMGLGKTPTAIATVLLHPEMRPALVCCPASMQHKWVAQFNHWGRKIGIRAAVLTDVWYKEGRNRPAQDKAGNPYDVVVMTTDSLATRASSKSERSPSQERLRWIKNRFKSVIVDEFHHCKNPASGRTIGLFDVLSTMPGSKRVALTGTPMGNDARELFPLIRFVRPSILELSDDAPHHAVMESMERWNTKYALCGYKTIRIDNPNWKPGMPEELRKFEREIEVWGVRDPDAMACLLRTGSPDGSGHAPLMGRRLKSDLGILPKKTVSYVTVDVPPDPAMDPLDAMDKAQNKEQRKLIFAQQRVRIGMAKVPHAADLGMSLIQERHPDGGTDPMVYFLHHQDVLRALKDDLVARGADPDRIAWIDGSVDVEDRFHIEERFQAGHIDHLLLSQAAKEGLTLTRANRMIVVEREPVPIWEAQLEDRIYRISQTRPASILYMMANDPIDERLGAIVDRKKADLRSAIEGDLVWSASVSSDITSLVIASLLGRPVEEDEDDANPFE